MVACTGLGLWFAGHTESGFEAMIGSFPPQMVYEMAMTDDGSMVLRFSLALLPTVLVLLAGMDSQIPRLLLQIY